MIFLPGGEGHDPWLCPFSQSFFQQRPLAVREESDALDGKHILTEQKNIKFSKKYLINIFQSPLY